MMTAAIMTNPVKTSNGVTVMIAHRACCRASSAGRVGVWGGHSMTSSARASSEGGTSRPRALAVFRLITNSYLRFVRLTSIRFPPVTLQLTASLSLNHPHRRRCVRIPDLRNRLMADLAQCPNWEARARRFDGRSGIRTSMRLTPASRRPARVQCLRFAGADMLGRAVLQILRQASGCPRRSENDQRDCSDSYQKPTD